MGTEDSFPSSIVYRQLFGEEDDDVGELDDAAKAGENGEPCYPKK